LSGRIVVSLPDKANEYQVLQAKDAQSTASRLGLDIEVVYAEDNAILQIQQVFKAMHGEPRPAGIVMEPVSLQGLERVVQNAAASGIGFALLNCTVSFLEGLRSQFPRVALLVVGSDQVEIGRIQGRQIRLLAPSPGMVLYIQGPLTASAARERLQGMEETIQGAEIRTVILDSLWSEESAERAVQSWLRLKTSEGAPIDLVACQDDSMALGARRALSATTGAVKRVPFLGIDGLPQYGQRLVDSGVLSATVVMPSNTGPALEALGQWIRSGSVPGGSLRLPVRSYPPEDDLLKRFLGRKA
jgi:ABC-type sugar transport system substrate-binding protein